MTLTAPGGENKSILSGPGMGGMPAAVPPPAPVAPPGGQQVDLQQLLGRVRAYALPAVLLTYLTQQPSPCTTHRLRVCDARRPHPARRTPPERARRRQSAGLESQASIELIN